MKLTTILLFIMLAMGFIIWMGNILLAIMEMDERWVEMWENLKLESGEQESCQNGGNPEKRNRK